MGVYERKPGSGVWYVQWYDHKGQRHRQKIGPKGLAQKVYFKCKAADAERRFLPEQAPRAILRVGEMIDRFLMSRHRDSMDYRRYAREWKAALGSERPATEGASAMIRERTLERREEVSVATVNRELTFLRAAFNLAIADEILVTRNPVSRRLFGREDLFARERYLTWEEESRLRAEIPAAEHWALVEAAMSTGIRRGRLFALRWSDVDLVNRHITIPRAKGGRTYRVPIGDSMLALLEARPRTCDWVFPGPHAIGPRDPKAFVKKVFGPALERAGIVDFHWHDLRHTFGTRLAMSGATLQEIQSLLGHLTPSMTLRYAHIVDEYRRRALDRHDALRRTSMESRATA